MTDYDHFPDGELMENDSPQVNDLQSFAELAAAEDKSLVGESQMTWLSPQLIEEEDGFNERDYDEPKTAAHIEKLAQAWAKNAQIKPIEVKVVNGHCYVRDGHCRLRGARLAISRGAMIKRIPVIELKGNNQLDTVRILTSNDQLSLTIMQRARLYQRLRSWNWDDNHVADHIGKTATHVRETVRLLTLPDEIQDLLVKEVIKPHLALDLFRKYGKESVQIIMSSYEKRKAEQELFYPELGSGLTESQNVASPDSEAKASNATSGPEQNSSEKEAPTGPPPIRLTSRNIAVPTRRIGKKLVTTMASSMTGISQVMRSSAVIDAKTGTVAISIPVDIYEKFLAISDEAGRHRDDDAKNQQESKEAQENLNLVD